MDRLDIIFQTKTKNTASLCVLMYGKLIALLISYFRLKLEKKTATTVVRTYVRYMGRLDLVFQTKTPQRLRRNSEHLYTIMLIALVSTKNPKNLLELLSGYEKRTPPASVVSRAYPPEKHGLSHV